MKRHNVQATATAGTMLKYKSVLKILALALAAAPAAAQEPDSLAVQRQEYNKQAGVEKLELLTLLLHQALQTNNFDAVSQHLANKYVYDKMMQLGTAPVRETLLLYTPTDMLLDFQRDFGKVVQDGVLLEVNWPATYIREVTFADTPAAHNAVIFPVQLHLSSAIGMPFQVHFNVARLDGRYYLLPPLRLPEEY
ncbi:hypothetical protein [uncultured Pontibacter sp.]|uniref:hypothetical protein n=1 Tax=uncultured Pontibacter sp. TaxID=453356 RepID=UPI002629E7C6|nr:hypothetical protein [uncultured Pontibacter sp.]